MIFVTVGTQLPFDRLVMWVDRFAAERQAAVFAQIGDGTTPRSSDFARTLDPVAFRAGVESADVVVAHAGIGAILSALEAQTPIIIVPRRADLAEHRNDHQLATARSFLDTPGVSVAHDEATLHDLLSRRMELRSGSSFRKTASPPLLGAIAEFISRSSR